jgi:phosphatidylinositol alpha-1,6-mannosyltransferase
VANSLATRKDFIDRYNPVDNWRCETVLWGVDHLVFHPLNKDDEDSQLAHEAVRMKYGCADEDALHGNPETQTPLILAVGRLVARKGFLTLLRAMPEILAKNPAAKLVIVGRGHMKSKLMKQAKSFGVADALSIESGMPFDDLAQLFRSADVVAYPSYYEGQGLIPLEAMSSGTPVVTVDHGPLPEMVDESVGGLFQLGDATDLAKQVNDLLANPDKVKQMAELGRQRVLSSYTYEHNAKDFESIYLSVVE